MVDMNKFHGKLIERTNKQTNKQTKKQTKRLEATKMNVIPFVNRSQSNEWPLGGRKISILYRMEMKGQNVRVGIVWLSLYRFCVSWWKKMVVYSRMIRTGSIIQKIPIL